METPREFIKKAGIVSAIGIMSEWAMAFPGSDRLGKVLPFGINSNHYAH
jgi:hypothetical protein